LIAAFHAMINEPRSTCSTKTAVGGKKDPLLAPFLSSETQKHVGNLLGRPFSAFYGVGFAEHRCGFFEKGGL